MTSIFRLMLAGAIAFSCFLFGLSFSGVNANYASPTSRASLTFNDRIAVEDVDRYVEAIYASDLFPASRLRSMLNGEMETPDTADGLAAALSDPSLSAFVKRENVWRIHLYAGFNGTRVREIGDQLSDGWIIQDIEPTAVLLKKDQEARRIEVFQVEPGAE